MRAIGATMGLVLALAAPCVAQAEPDAQDLVVVAGPEGSLAAKALSSGNFEAARRRLEPMPVYGENDPARLINLGNAYAGLGRMDQAREAYRAARFAPETVLVLANGDEQSSRAVATRALGRLNPAYAMR